MSGSQTRSACLRSTRSNKKRFVETRTAALGSAIFAIARRWAVSAPWLVGESDPHAKTSPDELYETLKPFKDKVAEDIKQSDPEGDSRRPKS